MKSQHPLDSTQCDGRVRVVGGLECVVQCDVVVRLVVRNLSPPNLNHLPPLVLSCLLTLYTAVMAVMSFYYDTHYLTIVIQIDEEARSSLGVSKLEGSRQPHAHAASCAA